MTFLLFTLEKENGIRSTSRENLAFELWLEQRCSVTRQNFHDLETVPGAAEQMPHQTVDLLGTERGTVKHTAVHTTLPSHPRESDSLFSKSKPCSITSPISTALQSLLSSFADGSSSRDYFSASACALNCLRWSVMCEGLHAMILIVLMHAGHLTTHSRNLAPSYRILEFLWLFPVHFYLLPSRDL